ncbi:DUF507 family protein [Lysinibacillus sp. MHQ-1]|nr:DUF507 family protein [Lysinibacillus sp. MHQ-1]
MQRYDDSKKGLLDYYGDVDAETAKQYTAQLEHVSNKTMRDLSNSQLVELDKTIDAIIKDLQSNKEAYEKKVIKGCLLFCGAICTNFKATYAIVFKRW